MCKCKICGNETAKNRQTCIGCDSVKKLTKKGSKAPKPIVEKAKEHLNNNPGLFQISWPSFFKKHTRNIV